MLTWVDSTPETKWSVTTKQLNIRDLKYNLEQNTITMTATPTGPHRACKYLLSEGQSKLLPVFYLLSNGHRQGANRPL